MRDPYSTLRPPVDGPNRVTTSELKDAGVVIRGERVRLIPHRVSDSVGMVSLIDFDRDHLRQFHEPTGNMYRKPLEFARSVAHPDKAFKLRFGIWHDYTVVGSINLMPLEGNRAQIGYWIGKQHVRKGYASDALAALSRFAFEQLGYDELQAKVDVGNIASRGVLAKAGFVDSNLIVKEPYLTDSGEIDFQQMNLYVMQRPTIEQ